MADNDMRLINECLDDLTKVNIGLFDPATQERTGLLLLIHEVYDTNLKSIQLTFAIFIIGVLVPLFIAFY